MKLGGSADERTAANEIERLVEENRRLRMRLSYLNSAQAALERRLERVENSVVFRCLRWLGGIFRSAGVRVDLARGGWSGASSEWDWAEQRYSGWAQETALVRHFPGSGSGTAALARTPQVPVTVLLQAHEPDRANFERALASIDAQQYPDWELFIATCTPLPDWMDACVAPLRSGHRVKIVPAGTFSAVLDSAIDQCRGEFLAILNSNVILEPDALERWLAAADSDTAAVYSDWDYVNVGGVRHTPRFTPEFSPELLSDSLYWGRCYLVRTTELRELGWPRDERATVPVQPPEHGLALRLAQRSSGVQRVARMLWHVQGERGASSRRLISSAIADRCADGQAGSASIIICSRKPAQLRKSLKSILPTLDKRHEVIVVAHHADDGALLERIASSHGARTVPYAGPFHFGVMNGLGANASRATMLCFLNDDVYPITKDWLELLMAQAARSTVGVAGALLQYPDGTIQHAGLTVGGRHFPAHLGRFLVESPYWPWLRMTREVSAVTGACMAMRRSVWDELGGFDPRFPVNFNDVDLCLRAAQRGYRVLLEARAVLTHAECMTRVPSVCPEENELLYELWSDVMNAPDKFFSPQFAVSGDFIELPKPWTRVR